MKKLMVAFMAITSAVVANAGAVNWTVDNIYKSDDSGEKASGYSVYFFVDSYTGAGFTGGADYVFSAADAATQIAAGNTAFVAKSLYLLGDTSGIALSGDGYAADFNVGHEDYSGVSGGMFVDNSTWRTTVTPPEPIDTVNGYFVIFDAATAADAKHAYIVDPFEIEMSSGEAFKDISVDATISSTAWQSVPEPTSGLLLLLGVAGLALKRKRT